MVIWKWICKQSKFVKIIGILLYLFLSLCLISLLIDSVCTAFVNAKNGSTTLKRELCWLAFWNVATILYFCISATINSGKFTIVSVLVGILLGTIVYYLPMFVLWHSIINPILLFCKKHLKETLISLSVFIIVVLIFGVAEKTKLPTCDSNFAVKEVEEIFKQNSQIYDYQNSVGQVVSLTVDNPRIDYYDKDSHKYYCIATVNLQVTGNYNFDTEVSYDITKSKGKPVVSASFSGKGRFGIY